MKILELALLAFGPFTDEVLDLGGGREGLHLIYGPNEAGKSSALRALRQALFGIPPQSPDDFLHPYAKLRIGLTLRAADGRELRFWRRKGTRNTLFAADHCSSLPEEEVKAFLGGLSEPDFRRRFALDHEDLVAGGREILGGGGELGPLLFQAGGGLVHLRETQRELEERMETLFKPTGTKPRINACLSELRQAQRRFREAALPSTAWTEHEEAAQRIAAQLKDLETALAARQTEKRRLERLKDAQPLLKRIDAWKAELAQLGEVPRLPESFSEARLKAVTDLHVAQSALQRSTEAIAELDRQLDHRVVPADFVNESQAIEQIREAIATNRERQRTLPSDLVRLDQLLASVHELLDDIVPRWECLFDEPENHPLTRPGRDPLTDSDRVSILRRLDAAAERLRMTQVQKREIQELISEHAHLKTELERSDREIRLQSQQLSDDQAALDRIPVPPDPDPLARALKQAREQGNLDGMVETARCELTLEEESAARALCQLPLWTGTLDALDAATAPSLETVDSFEIELGHLDAEARELRDEQRKWNDQAIQAAAALEQLQLSAGPIPTEAALDQARVHRNQLWVRIVEAWSNGSTLGGQAGEGHSKLENSSGGSVSQLVRDFEQAVVEADTLADRLRREADRVVQQAAAVASLHQAQSSLESLEIRQQELVGKTAEARHRWRAVWQGLGFEPLSPREMRGWLHARSSLTKQAAEIRKRKTDLALLESKLAHHRQSLAEALANVGNPIDLSDPTHTLASLRDRAEAELERIASVERRRSDLTASMIQLRQQIRTAHRQAQELRGRQESWNRRWITALGSITGGSSWTVDQAVEFLQKSTELQSQIREARAIHLKIAECQRSAANLEAEVWSLCQRLVPDLVRSDFLTPESAELAVQELLRRVHAAREIQIERDNLLRQRETEVATQTKAMLALEETKGRLAALCQEARCDSVDELPRVEEASHRARDLRLRLEELEERLCELRGSEPEDVFRHEALALDLDQIPETLARWTEEIARFDRLRSELNQKLGRERQILEQMDGSGEAAEVAERIEDLKARLTGDLEEYARLRLAAFVLREAIERYRKKTQGPVLSLAGTLFSELTLGSFEGLRVDDDERGRPMLQAVRPGRTESIGIQGLSLGTADQLYLALRLASLETYLANHPPIPLIVDDILIQFDDDRARAALRVLSRLSQRTQIILFTHHQHVRELAKETVEPDRLFLHELGGFSKRAASGCSRTESSTSTLSSAAR